MNDTKHTSPAGLRKAPRRPGPTSEQQRTDWLERLALCLDPNAPSWSWSRMSKTTKYQLRAKIWTAFVAAVNDPERAAAIVTRMDE